MFSTCVSVVSATSCSLRLLSITPGLGVFACTAPARLLFCRPRAALFSPSRVLRQWRTWPASKISTPFARVEHQTIQIGYKRDSKFDSSIMLFVPHPTHHTPLVSSSTLIFSRASQRLALLGSDLVYRLRGGVGKGASGPIGQQINTRVARRSIAPYARFTSEK